MAIMDWHSRYVLNWALSTTLEADFCIEAVTEALAHGSCEIFNTIRVHSLPLPGFTQPLIDKGMPVSMDGRGRALDNIFVERLWRSVKYEKVYLQNFQSVKEAYQQLKDYFRRCNKITWTIWVDMNSGDVMIIAWNQRPYQNRG